MLTETLGFIGGGNMARSLIGGLLARGLPSRNIIVADPIAMQRESLAAQLGVRVTDDNTFAVRNAQIVVLAVKPQALDGVAKQIAPALAHRPLIVSIAAGIRAADIERWLNGVPVVRAMPNTPALNSCGVSGLYAAAGISSPQRKLAENILGAVGPVVWVEREEQMDVVTAVSGSGPAYFFLLVEMLEAAGIELGLPADVSRKLAIETAYGSGQMVHSATETPTILRERVTSKGGTTEAALKSLESANVRAIFVAAVAAAAKRSAEMADEFGSR